MSRSSKRKSGTSKRSESAKKPARKPEASGSDAVSPTAGQEQSAISAGQAQNVSTWTPMYVGASPGALDFDNPLPAKPSLQQQQQLLSADDAEADSVAGKRRRGCAAFCCGKEKKKKNEKKSRRARQKKQREGTRKRRKFCFCC